MTQFIVNLALIVGFSALLLNIDLSQDLPYLVLLTLAEPVRAAILGIVLSLYIWTLYRADRQNEYAWIETVNFYLTRLTILYPIMVVTVILLLGLPIRMLYRATCCSALGVGLLFTVALDLICGLLVFTASYGLLFWHAGIRPFRADGALFTFSILAAMILIFPKLLILPLYLSDLLFNGGRFFS